MILLACVAGGLLGSLHNRRLRMDERGEKIEKALKRLWPVVQAMIPYAAEGHQITMCVDHLSCCQRWKCV